MKLLLVSITVPLFLIGCDAQPNHSPTELDSLDVSAAVVDGQRYLGEGSKIVAVCGPSKGVSLYLDDYEDGYTLDGISDGVLIFGFDANNQPEILSRDVFKEMEVMGEGPDGANISFTPDPDDGRLGVWVANFSNSRVVEVHNLTVNSEGQLLDLWTSNKPADSVIKARTFAFHSKCEFAV